MPYKDKVKDREWHREHMRQKRTVTPVLNVTPEIKQFVTPVIEPKALRKFRDKYGR